MPEIISVEKVASMPAAELIKWLHSFSTGAETIETPTGQMIVRDFAIPIIKKYSATYQDIEFRATIGQTGAHSAIVAKMDLSEVIERMRRVRQMLSHIACPMAYTCATFEIDGFNFAYIYLLNLKGRITIAYISLGDTLISADGEWRPMLMDGDEYTLAITAYGNLVDTIVECGPTTAPTLHLFGASEAGMLPKDVHTYLSEGKFGARLLALTWFVAHYETKREMTQPHSSPQYIKLGVSGSSAAADRLFVLLGEQKAALMYALLGSFGSLDQKHRVQFEVDHSVRVGQKLVRLTPDELGHPMNDMYPAWKEISTVRAVTDLGINMISPSFATYGFWFFIRDAGKTLWNLAESRDAIAMSESIRMTPADKRADKVLSDAAVCLAIEYVGPTFGSVIASDSDSIDPRFLFDIIYGLLCMNVKLGKIHGDMHCHNATISGIVRPGVGHVIYRIEDSDYVFAHTGQYGCVIDFSRVMDIGDVTFVERIADKYTAYFKAEVAAAAALFDAFVYGALEGTEAMFNLAHVASAFDAYEFSSSLLANAKESASGPFMKKVVEVRDMAKRLLLEPLSKRVAGGKKRVGRSATADWANAKIIAELWRPGDVSAIQSKKVYGFWCIDNKMQYSIATYERLPRSIRSTPLARDSHDTPADGWMVTTNRIRIRYEVEKEAATAFGR
jgi:hypothetical protein